MMPTLLVFLKAPIPGLVKTRLAQKLGNEEACAVYKKLVARQMTSIPKAWNVQIHYDGCKDAVEIEQWIGRQDFKYCRQADGDLGARLHHAFESTIASSSESSVFAIGGDCPYLNEGIIVNAESLLKDVDVVIGPAKDGGYYLIGMRKFHSACFQNIAWSTSEVLAQTLEHLRREGLSYSLLECLEDVDDMESFERAQSYLL